MRLSHTLESLRGRAAMPSAVRADPPTPLTGQPRRLAIPGIELSTSVGSLPAPSDGRIDPPRTGLAYWLEGSGTAGPDSQGTAYIAGHILPGGALSGLFRRATSLAHGIDGGERSEVWVDAHGVGTCFYTVTGVERFEEPTAAQEAELLRPVPRRLIVLALRGHPDRLPFETVALFAHLDEGD